MSRRKITVYLAILALAVLVWIPLFPLLFAFEEQTVSRMVSLHKTMPQYVYFGDSVITTTTRCETDHRTILEMLPDDVRKRTGGFNSPGYTPLLWRSAARFFVGRGQGHIRAAVLPINMGVFSPQWGGNPDYDFTRARILFDAASGTLSPGEYAHLVKRTHLDVLVDRHAHAVRQWQNTPILLNGRSLGRIQDVDAVLSHMPKFSCTEDLEKDRNLLGQKFVLNYGRAITANDAMLGYIGETVARLKAAGIPTILYITPLNVEDIGRFGGAQLLHQMEENLAVVRAAARSQGWQLIDLSHAFPSARFIDRECACEHVDAAGRAFIAAQAAAALRRLPGTDLPAPVH